MRIENNKNTLTALIIRLRLYLVSQYYYCRTEEERYDFAGMVLNVSSNRARRILHDNPEIKKLSKFECELWLKKLNYIMYLVAVCDIEHKKRKNNE